MEARSVCSRGVLTTSCSTEEHGNIHPPVPRWMTDELLQALCPLPTRQQEERNVRKADTIEHLLLPGTMPCAIADSILHRKGQSWQNAALFSGCCTVHLGPGQGFVRAERNCLHVSFCLCSPAVTYFLQQVCRLLWTPPGGSHPPSPRPVWLRQRAGCRLTGQRSV